jgi:hypothetical protein
MISGYVDRTWAGHHYTRWYRETFPENLSAGARFAPAASLPLVETPGSVCCSGCGACND